MDKTVQVVPPNLFRQGICRTCLRCITTPAYKYIHSQERFYKGRLLCELFTELSLIEMKQDDLLPLYICSICATRLKHSISFKRQIEKANTILKNTIRMAELKSSNERVWKNICRGYCHVRDEFDMFYRSIQNHKPNKPSVPPQGMTRKDVNILKEWDLQKNTDPKVNNNPISPIAPEQKTAPIPIDNSLNDVKIKCVASVAKPKQKAVIITKSPSVLKSPSNSNQPPKSLSNDQPLKCTTSTQPPKILNNNWPQNSEVKNRTITKNSPSGTLLTGASPNSNQKNVVLLNTMATSKPKMNKPLVTSKNVAPVIKPEIVEQEIQQNNSSTTVVNLNTTEFKEKENISELDIIRNDSSFANELEIKYEESDSTNIFCKECNKTFTSVTILNRHLLYHSLNILEIEKHRPKPLYPLVPASSQTVPLDLEELAREAAQNKPKVQTSNDSASEIPLVKVFGNRLRALLEEKVPDNKVKRIPCYNKVPVKLPSNDKMEICRFCKKEVPKNEIVEHHLKKHNFCEDLLKKCKYCDERMLPYDVKSHILSRHRKQHYESKKRYPCPICKMFFRSNRLLQRHIAVHTKYQCKHCEKSFKHKKYYDEHLTKDHNVKITYLCYICGKMVSGTFFTYHIRSHILEKNIKCTVEGCNDVLKYSSSLRDHILRKHGTEKPFICDRCGKAFSVRATLQQHMRRHSDIKPFVCEVCKKGFWNSSKMKLHVRVQHLGDKPFTCPVPSCPQVFSVRQSIVKHCHRYHPDHPIAKTRKKKIYDAKPVVAKTFICVQCRRKFATEMNLNKHYKLFHPMHYFNMCDEQLQVQD